MRPLSKPTYSPETVFRTCIDRVRDSELKSRLDACVPDVVDDSRTYERHLKRQTVHLMEERDVVGVDVSVQEMIRVYNNGMVRSTAPGRQYYDALTNAPKNGICPLCGHRTVETLDHYLPKTIFPSLVVTPLNLIPSCWECNHAKSAAQPSTRDEEPVNPYFDDLQRERWLFAEVLEGDPVGFRFYLKAPELWDEITTRRVQRHFDDLRLNMLYVNQADAELADHRHRLANMYRDAGHDALQSHLLDSAISCGQQYINYWKTAMYEALSKNERFCNGGVLLG